MNRPHERSPDPDVLDRNLHALIGRSYQAKAPRPAFRAELKDQVLSSVVLSGSASLRVRPRISAWLLPMLTAAIVAVSAAWWFRPAPEVLPSGLSAILASQKTALQEMRGGQWVEATGDFGGVVLFEERDFLGVRTPDQESFGVRFGESVALRVGADSLVELSRKNAAGGSAHGVAEGDLEVVVDDVHVAIVSGHASVGRDGFERSLVAGDRGLLSDLLATSPPGSGGRTVMVGEEERERDEEEPPDLVLRAFDERSSTRIETYQVDAMPLWYAGEDHGAWMSQTISVEVDADEVGGDLSKPPIEPRTDGASSAKIDGVRAGRYVLFVRAEGYGPWRSAEVLLGGDHPPLELRVDLRPAQSLRGRVVDEVSGLPIEDAVVFSETDSSSMWIPVELGAGTTGPTPRVFRTDADGYFEASGIGLGPQELRAWKEGYAPTWTVVDDVAGAYVEISLRVGASIAGTVVDGLTPVSYGTVVAVGQFSVEAPGVQPFAFSRCDEMGGYELSDLPEGVYVVMAFTNDQPMDGAPALKITEAQVATPTTLDFRISGASSTLNGTLLDRDGIPFPNQPVSFVAEGQALVPDARGWISTATDSEGRFFVDLPPGSYEVFLVLGQGISVQRIARCVAPADSIQIQVTGTEVTGVVRDADNGTPLPGAICVLLGEGEAFYGKVVADASGRYSFSSVPSGVCVVIAHSSSDGYAPGQSAPLQVVGSPIEVDVRMPRGGALEVTVVDSRGDPASGVRVSIENPETYSLDADHGRTTGQSGRVRLQTLPAKRLTVLARRGDTEVKTEVVVPIDGTEQITVSFPSDG